MTRMTQLYGGRSADNDIVIASPVVSARHFCIALYDTGEIAIRDLESTNGTFVNQQRIGNTFIALKENDIVMLGDIIFDWKKYHQVKQVGTLSEIVTKSNLKKYTAIPKKYSSVQKVFFYALIIFFVLILIWYFTQVTHPII